MGWLFFLPVTVVGSKRTPASRVHRTLKLGATCRWHVAQVRGKAAQRRQWRKQQAAFKEVSPMAEPRMGTDIGRHDEGKKLAQRADNG